MFPLFTVVLQMRQICIGGRELYLFTHVDGLCWWVSYRQGTQSLSNAAALPCCVTPTMLFFVPPGVLGLTSIKGDSGG